MKICNDDFDADDVDDDDDGEEEDNDDGDILAQGQTRDEALSQ